MARFERSAALERIMRTSCIALFALLLVGCSTSTQQSTGLTQEQAQRLAVQLANDKASTVHHCQPFRSGQAARLEKGRWVWFERQGYGYGEFEATVELAANGSTNSVNLQFLDNRARSPRGVSTFR